MNRLIWQADRVSHPALLPWLAKARGSQFHRGRHLTTHNHTRTAIRAPQPTNPAAFQALTPSFSDALVLLGRARIAGRRRRVIFLGGVQPNRERLKKILGVVDPRRPPWLEYISGPGQPALLAEAEGFKVYAVRWAVFPGVDAEGLLLEPNSEPAANIVVNPDADWTPEALAGLAPGAPVAAQTPAMWAGLGFRVLIPTLIDRKDDYSGNPKLGRFTNQPHREFIYRMAYEMGRHILGYEIQKVLAGVDWMQANSKPDAAELVAVVGYGEGGLIARLAVAIDERIKFVAPLGQGGPAETMWAEPIYRNLCHQSSRTEKVA